MIKIVKTKNFSSENKIDCEKDLIFIRQNINVQTTNAIGKECIFKQFLSIIEDIVKNRTLH
ncbi:hypothetical protein M0R19_06220 [Candidatus Pacearchaeota archaeon]|jgi:hypothetical protein|nr:hypothetical protein [Candidatus Pacearchaeota archaeon]